MRHIRRTRGFRGEAYGLAADIVTRTSATGQIDKLLDKLLDKLRIRMIAMVVLKSGKTESEAAGIVDTIVFPLIRDAMPMMRSVIVATQVRQALHNHAAETRQKGVTL